MLPVLFTEESSSGRRNGGVLFSWIGSVVMGKLVVKAIEWLTSGSPVCSTNKSAQPVTGGCGLGSLLG